MKIVLHLYISGKSLRTDKAVHDLQRVLDQNHGSAYSLSVHDVSERPDLAEEKKILAIPTLDLLAPPPAKRIIGDLSDTEKVFRYLGLPYRKMQANGDPEIPDPENTSQGDETRENR